MRTLYSLLLLFAPHLLGQTVADALADKMLARADSAQWGAPYAGGKNCQPWIPFQQARRASEQWSYECTSRADGVIEDSFFYAFDEFGPVRLKMEVRPEPPVDVDIARLLNARLTKQFGPPAHQASMMEVGLPFAGDHWGSAKLHVFLFQNPAGRAAVVKGAVQLVVVDKRLFQELQKDDFIQQADVLFYPADPAQPFLRRLVGDYYIHLLDAIPKATLERQILAQQTYRQIMGLLGVNKRSLFDERAMLLLAVNGLVTKLSTLLVDSDSEASSMRSQLASFNVKLGPQTHDGGLAYDQDLLWRVLLEYPDSQAGQLAFVELQQRGWYTSPDIGCPANPDLFHDVIEHGEGFLAQHPATPFRKEILFTLAVANESWWSIAHASATDGWLDGIPYPRKDVNKEQAAAARERAIRYYQEIVNLAPDSPEAASAERRLPRLELALDTGQRRFFCSYD